MFFLNFYLRLKKLFSRHGFGSGKKMTLEKAVKSNFDLTKLHLGCGNIYIPTFCNVDVLIPGGELRISVPDLDAITKIYQKNIAHFQTPGNQPWIALFYGGQ
jgi:hypothetical protein